MEFMILLLGVLGWSSLDFKFENVLLSSIILVGLFGALTGYANRDEYAHRGIYNPEGNVVWTSKNAAFDLCVVDGSEYSLEMQSLHPDLSNKPLEVGISLEGSEASMKAVLKSNSWTTINYKVLLNQATPSRLFLNVDRTWSPLRTGSGMDARQLGVRVKITDSFCPLK